MAPVILVVIFESRPFGSEQLYLYMDPIVFAFTPSAFFLRILSALFFVAGAGSIGRISDLLDLIAAESPGFKSTWKRNESDMAGS